MDMREVKLTVKLKLNQCRWPIGTDKRLLKSLTIKKARQGFVVFIGAKIFIRSLFRINTTLNHKNRDW
jgi:hypothetical protein